MNWKECARKRSWPARGTTPEFVWGYWGKSQGTSVRIAEVPAEIRPEHLRSASSEPYPTEQSAQWVGKFLPSVLESVPVMYEYLGNI
jgi:hypothetical protein